MKQADTKRVDQSSGVITRSEINVAKPDCAGRQVAADQNGQIGRFIQAQGGAAVLGGGRSCPPE